MLIINQFCIEMTMTDEFFISKILLYVLAQQHDEILKLSVNMNVFTHTFSHDYKPFRFLNFSHLISYFFCFVKWWKWWKWAKSNPFCNPSSFHLQFIDSLSYKFIVMCAFLRSFIRYANQKHTTMQNKLFFQFR